jgi:hypothetical protein
MKLPPEMHASLKKAMLEGYGRTYTDYEIEALGVELIESFTIAIGGIVEAERKAKFESSRPSE